MTDSFTSVDKSPGALFQNPVPALVTSALIALLACAGDAANGASLAIALAGLAVLAAGIAVAIRPNSALIVLSASVVPGFVSWVGAPDQWDSARLALRVLGTVGLLAGLIVALPSLWRRVVVS